MQILTDDLEIFALLEKAGVATFNPTQTCVLEFSFEAGWHLLLFNPSGESKGCCLFIIQQSELNTELENVLLPQLLLLEEKNNSAVLKDEALSLVERLLRQKRAEQLFFDGH